MLCHPQSRVPEDVQNLNDWELLTNTMLLTWTMPCTVDIY